MINAARSLSLVLGISALFSTAADAPLALVREGRATARIVLPSNRQWGKDNALILSERHSAVCLQGHLLQISGARLEVIGEKELEAGVENGRVVAPKLEDGVENVVLVGEGLLARELGVTSDGLKPGGMRIKTVGNALVLMGHPVISHPTGDGGGVRAAVRAFLESLGCRYLWPGESGKVIPRMTSITVGATDMTYIPPIGQRRVRNTSTRSRRFRTGLRRLGIAEEEYAEVYRKAHRTRVDALVKPSRYVRGVDFPFSVWHGVGGNIGVGGGHAFGGTWEKWGKEHPEWFALQPDGTRDQSAAGSRERLCVSNPGLHEAIAQDILEQARKHPDKRCFSICPNDGGYSNFCLCDACKALDPKDGPRINMLIFEKVGKPQRKSVEYVSLTDRYIFFSNEIAKRVAKERPDLLLLIQAYSLYQDPPVRRKLHPNLVLRYVPDDASKWDGWQKAGAKRIYWRPNILIRGRRTGDLNVYARSMTQTFHVLTAKGMIATDMDSIMHNWAAQGLNYYVALRLNWNPTLTYDAILDDFCRSGFGAAAPHVKRYFLAAEEAYFKRREVNSRGPYPAETIGALRSHLNAAAEAAAGDEASLARVAFLGLGLNYTDLHSELGRAAERAKAGKPVDRDRVGLLLDVNYLLLRGLALNRPLALNAGVLMWGSGDFAAWQKIGGRGYRPAAELLRRVDVEGRSPTGIEKSVDDMLEAFGLDAGGKKSRGRNTDSRKTVMEADEEGKAREVPDD